MWSDTEFLDFSVTRQLARLRLAEFIFSFSWKFYCDSKEDFVVHTLSVVLLLAYDFLGHLGGE